MLDIVKIGFMKMRAIQVLLFSFFLFPVYAVRQTDSSSLTDKIWIPQALSDKTFGLEVERVFLPQGVKRLQPSWLFLVRNGRVRADLPYLGRYSSPNLSVEHRQLVEIDGMAVDYRVDTLRRGAFRLKFKVYQVGETFTFELRIGKDAYATLYLQSSMRSEIRYSGILKIVPGWKTGMKEAGERVSVDTVH